MTSKYRADGSLKPAAVRWRIKTIVHILQALDPADLNRIDTANMEVMLSLVDNIYRRQASRKTEGDQIDAARSSEG
jgi:hypothetical protein